MFAVVIYRNDSGLRCVHELASTRAQPEPQTMFEGMDYLKVEWCRKSELQKPDLKTLRDAGFTPKGRGAIWPRFESSQPGWYPWGLSEARQMTELLGKVGRFIYLRQSSGSFHKGPIEAEIPIVPPGEESTLRAEEIAWLPLVPAPATMPEPFILSSINRDVIRGFPLRQDFVAEMTAPLVPELSLVDETEGRPCIGRVGFIVDCRNITVLCARIVHGAAALGEAIGPSLIEALRNAKARPVVIRVDDDRLAAALRPACAEIDVGVSVEPLEITPVIWQDFESSFGIHTLR